MAAQKSTSARSPRSPKPGRQAVPQAHHARRGAKPTRHPKPDLGAILGRFADALSVIETVSRALQAAEDNGEASAISSEIATLRQGVTALRGVYNAVDVAILDVEVES